MSAIDRFMRGQLKLRHLRLLLALDEQRSVGRAAAYLNVSQPAVSKALGEIERELDAPLFLRTGRGLNPTEHGRILLRHARDILGHLNQAKEELRTLSEGRMTRVSLGVMPAASVQFVPRLIARLAERQPDVSISVREGTAGSMLAAMRAGDVDMTMGLLSEVRAGELDYEELFEDYVVAVVRPGHPLTHSRTIDWSDMAQYPMVLPPQGSILRTPVEAYLSQHGLGMPRWNVETISTATSLGVLQYSPAVAFLTAEMARHYVAQGSLAVVPLNMLRLTLHIGLIWLAGTGQDAAQQLIRQLVLETRDAMLPDMRAFRAQMQAHMDLNARA